MLSFTTFSSLILTVIRYGFTEPSYSVAEEAGPLQAFLQLTMDSGIPLSEFLVTVSTSDETAMCKYTFLGVNFINCMHTFQ